MQIGGYKSYKFCFDATFFMVNINNLQWSGVGVGESWVKSTDEGGEEEHKVK